MTFRVLVALTIVSALFARRADADCAPRCDFLVCDGAGQPTGLARASVLSVTPGEYPENPSYDAIEVEIVAMESETGNSGWVGERFTFRQDGFLATEPGDEIVFWVPEELPSAGAFRPAIYLAEGSDLTCDGGRGAIEDIANAKDLDSCLAAFSGLESGACDDTGPLCTVGGSGGGAPLWLAALALALAFLRRPGRGRRSDS